MCRFSMIQHDTAEIHDSKPDSRPGSIHAFLKLRCCEDSDGKPAPKTEMQKGFDPGK